MTDAVAIVLAAGSGDRLGADLPKAFVPLGDRPLILHAVDTVLASRAIDRVVVAVPDGWEARVRALLDPRCDVVVGGATRRASTLLALEAIGGDADVVGCHDAARPLAPPALVDAVVEALDGVDGVVPGIPVADTLKRVEGDRVVATEPREGLVAVQTPQAFRAAAFRDAHARAAVDVTDDAMALELAGYRIRVIPGDAMAFKITTADDLERARRAIGG
ncbi:MAG: 2-C-methyl-D-erythritol 4-phosphate cytidylyltransferase [Actinomycetota bacterium]